MKGSGCKSALHQLNFYLDNSIYIWIFIVAFDTLRDPSSRFIQGASGDEGMVISNSNSFLNGETKMETPNVKKRHRRMKSSSVKNADFDGKKSF